MACDARIPYYIIGIYECIIIHHNTLYIVGVFGPKHRCLYFLWDFSRMDKYLDSYGYAYIYWCTDVRIVYLNNVQSWRECDERERERSGNRCKQ